MRDIIFRGKRKDNGEWVEGYYVHAPAKNFINSSPLDDGIIKHWIVTSKGRMYEVTPQTIGQYTGLTDKNGKKIFEGDIVEHHAQADIIVNRGVVNWDSKNARWALQLRTINPSFGYKPEAIEIIGNVHDNIELLGGVNHG